MKILRSIVLTILLGAVSGAAMASDVDVKAIWVRGTVAGQKATGAFMEVTSESGATLVGAFSPVAGLTEIHEMRMEGGVMKMRAVTRLELPAGQTVKLAPGGYHVMLMDLKQALKPGEFVPLSLTVEGKGKKTETIEVKGEVRDLIAMPVKH